MIRMAEEAREPAVPSTKSGKDEFRKVGKLLTVSGAYSPQTGDSQEVAQRLKQIECMSYAQAAAHRCQRGR